MPECNIQLHSYNHLNYIQALNNKDALELEYNECSPEEKMVIKALRTPLPKDELLAELDLPINQANAVLSIMELKGLIKETLGEVHLT